MRNQSPPQRGGPERSASATARSMKQGRGGHSRFMFLFPIKAVTFVWRFVVLLVWTAYLEGTRDVKS